MKMTYRGLVAGAATLAAVGCLWARDAAFEQATLTETIARDHRVIRTDEFYGGRRTVFDFEGCEAWVVEPPAGVKTAPGSPWTWVQQWSTAFVPRTGVPQILRRGFHHVTVDTFKHRMDAEGLAVSRRFQAYLVGTLGFAPKARLIGLSWGGFFAIRYAAYNPGAVESIYLDAPLLSLDALKWPPNRASIQTWFDRVPAGGSWATDPEMPVNLAERIAADNIPVLLLYGGQDQTVIPAQSCEVFADRFRRLGGDIEVVRRGLFGHHPHGVEVGDTKLADFYEKKVRKERRLAVPWNLTCERRRNPVGVESARPRLSWRLPDGVTAQTAYEIEADGWRSGKVASADQIDVEWNGAPLAGSARVSWKVRVWDERGRVSGWSLPATFVTGVKDAWRASWIGPDPLTRPDRAPDDELATPAFAKTFSVKGPVARATLHVTGLGFYRAYLNGRRIGEKELDPSPTDYTRRVLYSTYLLDGALTNGANTLRIDLGHGWYDMRSRASWQFSEAPWRAAPTAIAQLEIDYADGSRETVVTDGTWDQVDSPVIFDDLREGEVRGMRRAEHLKVPAGLKARVVKGPAGRLEAEGLPGARVVDWIAPTRVVRDAQGRWIVSFPEMLTGWARLDFRGLRAGEEVSIRYDENLTPEGGATVTSRREGHNPKKDGKPDERFIDMFYVSGAGTNFVKTATGMQYDHFISSGAATECFEPGFVWHGFRHLVIEGYRGELRPEDVRACFVRTGFETTGSFACSDAKLTELVRLACNSYRANFADGVPTDCPHREKLGWTGDAWVASELAQYFFENTAAYEKWYVDVVDTLKENGDLCCIVPTSGWGYHWGNGPVFDCVLGMVPMNLWLYRADRRLLDTAYPALVRYLGYLKTIETAPDLVAKGLGDWNARDRSKAPANEFVISCLYLRLREMTAEIAAIKGLSAEAAAFAADAARTRAAIRAKYAKGDGTFANGVQCAQAMAVMFGLTEADEHAAVAAKLVESVEKMNGEVDFGLMGAKWVYRALSEIGRGDLALRMLTHPTGPSPARWIGQSGALWEDWGFGLSKCHVMLGDFAAWAMRYVAGLSPARPGFAEIAVEPTVIPGLTWAKGELESPYGRIEASWRIEQGVFELDVVVPPGSVAKVRMPSGRTFKATGRAHFSEQAAR